MTLTPSSRAVSLDLERDEVALRTRESWKEDHESDPSPSMSGL